MALDLSNRKWPELKKRRNWADADWAAIRRFQSGAFVTKGTMIVKELAFTGILRPIPPGECAITSLAVGDERFIYGATSGRRAHLFRYCPRGADGAVVDMGLIGEETDVRNSLVVTKTGKIIGGTTSDRENYDGGQIFHSSAAMVHGNFIQEWGLRETEIKLVLRPFENEGIGWLVYDGGSDTIYGISDRSGTLFVYDYEKNEVEKISVIDEKGFSTALALGGDGYVYGAGSQGCLFRYRRSGKLESLDISLTAGPGGESADEVDSLAFDQVTGRLYGGGRGSGALFSFHLETREVRSHGKPASFVRMKALTIGNDGRVYGITGNTDDLAHLFCYEPGGDNLEDLGIPLATLERRWYGYHFSCMVTGDDGELYLGQSERVSKLFIYFPDIPKEDPS